MGAVKKVDSRSERNLGTLSPYPKVAILLGTKNGAQYLSHQLQSYREQTHINWELFVSDDKSNDSTQDIIKSFAKTVAQRVHLREGADNGFCRNFLSLAQDPSIVADYYAFSDQDDIWFTDKLERAIRFLSNLAPAQPNLYCSRTCLIDQFGKHCGYSPLFGRRPSFENALVQNIGGGNTMVFNLAAKRLLEIGGELDVVSHDWWTYQVVSGAGGTVLYDKVPSVKYRQHEGNIIGSNIGNTARMRRARMVIAGQMKNWNRRNITALRSIGDVITATNRKKIDQFSYARSAPSLLRSFSSLKESGVYRQTAAGNLALVLATVLRKL